MFELVQTPKQQRKFEDTWETICRQSGWYNDPYGADAVRYNLLAPSRIPLLPKRVIGTIEFTPYDPANPFSTVEGPNRTSFTGYPDIMAFQTRTWEIDKLCLHGQYQRKGYFQGFMDIFYHHATTYKPKFYIALIEKRFYRMLKMTYGIHIEQRGTPLPGKDTALLPVVFNIEGLLQDHKSVTQLLSNQVHGFGRRRMG